MSREDAMRIDLIPMSTRPARDTIRSRLDDLLTRCFYSASGYVFESDPHAVPEDDDLIQAFGAIRTDDRRHAQVLGQLIQAQGGVPQPGVFPWWDQDLNYLTVPTLGTFVVEVLADEIRRYSELIARWPEGDLTGRAALEAVRAEKTRQVDDLRPRAAAAVAREVEARKAAAVALKKAREARLVKEKAAAEAARKAKTAAKAAPAAAAAAAAPSTALLDPNEPGISKKEKGRRAVMKIRAALGIKTGAGVAAAPAPLSAPSAPAGSDLPDPNEPGISPKEKARRTMLKMRASQAGAAPAAAAVPASAPAAAPAVDLPDPNEAGISPKEKARRTMLRMRAQSSTAASPAATPAGPAVAAPKAPPPAPSAAAAEAPALPADLGDPDEAGISPKEKARRTVARLRAKKG